MRIYKLAVLGLSLAMAFALSACGADKSESSSHAGSGNATSGEQAAPASKTLPFDGEWVEAGALKMGKPTGWTFTFGKAESGEGYASVDIESADGSMRVRVGYSESENVGSDDGSLEKKVRLQLTEAEYASAVFDRVEINGLTFARAVYRDRSGDAPTLYFYTTGHDSNGKAAEVTITLLGSYQESDLVQKIANSVNVTLPENLEAVKNTIVDFETAPGGPVELTAVKIATPDRWSVESADNRSAEFKTESVLGSVNVHAYDTATFQTSEEWSEKYNSNHGGGLTVTRETIGSIEYYRLDPADDQFILLADSPDGSMRIEVRGMHCALDEAQDLLEAIAFK